jgi:rhodanese-related sulfurtransferase
MRTAPFAVGFLLLPAACAPEQSVQGVNPEQVRELLDQKEEQGLFVLNVHTPYEGELEKTDAIIEDWEHIAAHADRLPQDKSTPLLVYCRTGRMSTSAVEQLRQIGYTDIYHADGGMRAYSQAGLPGLLNYSGG